MKKVLAAALICAASSFAAWDYFPVIEYGKGEAKIGFSLSRQGDYHRGGEAGTGTDFRIRYSPLANLEFMSTYVDANYVLGARYQVIPVLSAGVDIGFPIITPAWSFTPNIQFSMPLTDALALGSNIEVTINTEESYGQDGRGSKSQNKVTEGMDLSAGVELDLTLGKSTIWVSCDINTGLTASKVDGKVGKGPDGKDLAAKDEGRGLEIVPTLGYIATVGNLALGTSFGMEFGKDAGHENFNTIIGVDFSLKF